MHNLAVYILAIILDCYIVFSLMSYVCYIICLTFNTFQIVIGINSLKYLYLILYNWN